MPHPNGTALVLGANRPYGSEISARLRDEGYAVSEVRAETGDAAEIEAAFAPFETLDVLVVNTPVTRTDEHFLDITDAQFLAALQDQLFDVAAAGQAAIPRMRQGGRIIHIASRGYLGAWGGVHLMSATGALVGMTRSMALELAAANISVNAVCPDFVGSKDDTPEARQRIAGTVAYLAGRESALVTGQALLLDGAASMRMSESARR